MIAKTALLLLLCLAASVLAAEGEPEEVIPHKTHALQVNPVGPLLGSVTANYELLIGRRHGLFLELTHALGEDIAGNKLEGGGFSLNYRRHLDGHMKSSYVGIFLRRSETDADMKEEDIRIPFKYTALSFGPLYGSCHIWTSGLCLSWRLGYGYPIFDFEWTSDRRPEYPGLVRGLLKWTTNTDGGLTLGYAF